MSLNLASFSLAPTLPILLAVGSLACLDLIRRKRRQQTHLLFACVLGTFLAVGILRAIENGIEQGGVSPYVTALVLVGIVAGWRLLFGPWETNTKAAMLGTFLAWITVHVLWSIDGREQIVRLLAAGVALVPAMVWMLLFLRYHTERFSAVLLTFFAGMLATAPILFYDALVRRGVELRFFLFTITPESFSRTAQEFVTSHLSLPNGLPTVIATTVVTFALVAIIEEGSKYWVVSRSARPLFRSIDDVLQLSIMAAIGFAFAENVVNPVYFTAFVRDYFFHGAGADLSSFAGNILGRSVLTSMVHIFSTGIMGYFFGLALFAGPYLQERHREGHAYRLTRWVHRLLRVPEESVFRVNMMILGFVCAVTLHGVFNFLVTIPEVLPGNPSSLGEILPATPPFLRSVPFLVIPSVLYVVGGFWILTSLFLRKDNMIELGAVQPAVTADVRES